MKNSVSSLIKTIGTGHPVVVIVGGMHGNEQVGLHVFDMIQKSISPTKGTIKLITANPYALEKNVRYIDSDLNRSFPGKSDGCLEEKLAAKLVDEVRNCDYLLDLHSCSMETKPFCIVRTKGGVDMELARMTGLSHVVIYPRTRQGGGSLIDYVKCGIGLELGMHDARETIFEGYTATINVLVALGIVGKGGRIRHKKIKIFGIISHIKKPDGVRLNKDIKNFQLVRSGTVLGKIREKTMQKREDFYPVLYGEKAYKDILCMVARKI